MTTKTASGCIQVKARSFYLSHRSDPDNREFLFAYRILIKNETDQPARLMSRHWVITDGLGDVEEVRGPGVVGEQPRILPGESYEYTSTCPLPTQYGTMRGEYTMESDDGHVFEVPIPPFELYIAADAN